jgi:hypothetical protein
MAKSSRPAKTDKKKGTLRNSRTTVSGPAEPDASGAGLALGAGEKLLRACGVDAALPHGQADPGLIIASDPSAATDDFIAAIVKHRHFARETDPSRI